MVGLRRLTPCPLAARPWARSRWPSASVRSSISAASASHQAPAATWERTRPGRSMSARALSRATGTTLTARHFRHAARVQLGDEAGGLQVADEVVVFELSRVGGGR